MKKLAIALLLSSIATPSIAYPVSYSSGYSNSRRYSSVRSVDSTSTRTPEFSYYSPDERETYSSSFSDESGPGTTIDTVIGDGKTIGGTTDYIDSSSTSESTSTSDITSTSFSESDLDTSNSNVVTPTYRETLSLDELTFEGCIVFICGTVDITELGGRIASAPSRAEAQEEEDKLTEEELATLRANVDTLNGEYDTIDYDRSKGDQDRDLNGDNVSSSPSAFDGEFSNF